MELNSQTIGLWASGLTFPTSCRGSINYHLYGFPSWTTVDCPPETKPGNSSQINPPQTFHPLEKIVPKIEGNNEDDDNDDDNNSLIPGLPDDVSKQCLALVPRLHLPVISLVSKQWEAFLPSEEFRTIRKSIGSSEEWLYALASTPGNRVMNWQVLRPGCASWTDLPPMPGCDKTGFGYVVAGARLLVIGGLTEAAGGGRTLKGEALADVWMFNSVLNRWSKVASMHTARHDFACAVLGGCVYVVGGHGANGKKLSSVEVFDPQHNEWTSIACLRRARWGSFACVLKGRLFVMGGRSSLTIGNSKFMDVFDPAKGKWEEMKNGCVMVVAHTVVNDKLFCIEWKNDRNLAVYDVVENSWKMERLPRGAVGGNQGLAGFCLGNLNGELLVFPSKSDNSHSVFAIDPNGGGSDWHALASVCPKGYLHGCVNMAV